MYGLETVAVLRFGAGAITNVGLATEDLTRLDATSDEFTIIYRCIKAMTIDQIVLNVLNLTGTPTYQVSIQGVDVTNGEPDGTIKGGGSPASDQWAPAGNGLQWITLDNSYAVSKGDYIAIVIEDGTSGTDPSGSAYIDLVSHASQIPHNSPPYCLESTDTGSTWSTMQNILPSFGFRNSGATDVVMGNPIENWHTLADLGDSVGDINGQAIWLPVALGRRVQIGGLAIAYTFTNRECEIGIWDSDASATEIVKLAIDDDIQGNVASGQIVIFDTPAWLLTGHRYYAGMRHNEAAGNTAIYIHDCITDDNLSAFPGYPNNDYAFYNGSSWAINAGLISSGMELLVTDWDSNHEEGIQAIETGISGP